MWYGYVGPGIKGVTRNYREIEELLAVYPFMSFRKYRTEDKAWEFVGKRGNRKPLTNIIRYGNTFKDHYVTVEYFITKDAVYYNIFTKKLGYVKLLVNDPNVSVENRTELIKVKLFNIYLNKDFVSSHAIAIFHILKMLGSYVDVEVIVPDHSIYYMLSSYTGNKTSIVKVLKHIKARKGKISLTVKDRGVY